MYKLLAKHTHTTTQTFTCPHSFVLTERTFYDVAIMVAYTIIVVINNHNSIGITISPINTILCVLFKSICPGIWATTLYTVRNLRFQAKWGTSPMASPPIHPCNLVISSTFNNNYTLKWGGGAQLTFMQLTAHYHSHYTQHTHLTP